ncbi:MAG: hypothetical protein M0C28_17805 [Candidatus Moduliflexus flocculans]|nr:hypothetical protein [Candidatus Moduliflexus flocculans]
MGVGPVQLRLGAQLRAGAAAGAPDLPALPARDRRRSPKLLETVRHRPRALRRPGLSTRAPAASECHGTGYRGRGAITELLDLTDRICAR